MDDYVDVIADICDALDLSSDEELYHDRSNQLKAIDNGLISYDEAVCLGLMDTEDVVDTIGLDEAVSNGVLTKAEAKQWERESAILKSQPKPWED